MTPDTVNDFRTRIAADFDRIRECFTDAQEVADQMVRACGILLDVFKLLSVVGEDRNYAYVLIGNARNLESYYRRDEVTRKEYQTESNKLKLRVLDMVTNVEKQLRVELGDKAQELPKAA